MNPLLLEFEKIKDRLQHDCNRALHSFLAGFKQEVLGTDVPSWIQFTHPEWRQVDDPDWRLRFYLPADHVQSGVPWFTCSAPMVEFYRFFDGLRNSGDFARVSEVPRVEEDLPASRFPAFEVFREFPVVFHAINGDRLVHTSDGTFVWCQLETHEMPTCAASFDDLLAKWIAHHSIGDGFPFDSHGRD